MIFSVAFEFGNETYRNPFFRFVSFFALFWMSSASFIATLQLFIRGAPDTCPVVVVTRDRADTCPLVVVTRDTADHKKGYQGYRNTTKASFRCPECKLYVQVDRVAMGSPLGVLFAQARAGKSGWGGPDRIAGGWRWLPVSTYYLTSIVLD